MDLIVRTPADVRRRIRMGDSFLREVTSKGIVLHESHRTRVAGLQALPKPARSCGPRLAFEIPSASGSGPL